MLKKLKIKFIIVIMSIVTVLLTATFGMIMHLTAKNIENETIQMMRSISFHPPDHSGPVKRPEEADEMIHLPFIRIEISEDGEIKKIYDTGYFSDFDKDEIKNLADLASAKGKTTGIIHDYQMRFLKAENVYGLTIVFTDMSSEKAMIRGLMKNFLVTGSAVYILFGVISILLSSWTTKPVEKTWNEQKQFIADASHELKTPLTVIITNAEMLNENSYSEDDKKMFVKNILQTSGRMRKLVESLLELARLDNNRITVKYDSIDFSRLVSDSILPFEPLFFENGMTLSSDIDENIQITGCREKLGQVISILLDNALKYNKNEVTVKLKKTVQHTLLTFSGEGQPLSGNDCENIFRRFYRTDQARNDGQSYGLGLSIAESIVKEHNGRIWAESENGINTFFVSLKNNA